MLRVKYFEDYYALHKMFRKELSEDKAVIKYVVHVTASHHLELLEHECSKILGVQFNSLIEFCNSLLNLLLPDSEMISESELYLTLFSVYEKIFPEKSFDEFQSDYENLLEVYRVSFDREVINQLSDLGLTHDNLHILDEVSRSLIHRYSALDLIRKKLKEEKDFILRKSSIHLLDHAFLNRDEINIFDELSKNHEITYWISLKHIRIIEINGYSHFSKWITRDLDSINFEEIEKIENSQKSQNENQTQKIIHIADNEKFNSFEKIDVISSLDGHDTIIDFKIDKQQLWSVDYQREVQKYLSNWGVQYIGKPLNLLLRDIKKEHGAIGYKVKRLIKDFLVFIVESNNFDEMILSKKYFRAISYYVRRFLKQKSILTLKEESFHRFTCLADLNPSESKILITRLHDFKIDQWEEQLRMTFKDVYPYPYKYIFWAHQISFICSLIEFSGEIYIYKKDYEFLRNLYFHDDMDYKWITSSYDEQLCSPLLGTQEHKNSDNHDLRKPLEDLEKRDKESKAFKELSYSAMQLFVNCPQSFFYRYIKKQSPYYEKSLHSAAQKGIFEHKYIERAFLGDVDDQTLEDWLDDELDTEIERSYFLTKVEVEHFVKNNVPKIREILIKSNPYYFERELFEKIYFKIQNHKYEVNLIARCDLIVEMKEELLLIDFKRSSSSIPSKKAILDFNQFQMPFYMSRLKKMYPDKKINFGYWCLKNYEESMFIQDEESLLELPYKVYKNNNEKLILEYMKFEQTVLCDIMKPIYESNESGMTDKRSSYQAKYSAQLCQFCDFRNICQEYRERS